MNELDWDGDPLGPGEVALELLADELTPGDRPPRVTLVAASNGVRRCNIRPGQIAAFLLGHRGGRLVCYDVGPLHRALEGHLFRAAEWEARGTL